MSYYTYIDDCHQDIIYSLNEKIDRIKINDDDYITTLINENIINTTIYNKLLSFSSSNIEKFIKNYYNIFGRLFLFYKNDIIFLFILNIKCEKTKKI